MEKEYQWLPHLDRSIPSDIHGYALSMYCVALEGWRRGLKLGFYNKKGVGKNNIYFSLESNSKKYTFSQGRGNAVTKEAVKICVNKKLTKDKLIESNVPTPIGKRFKKEVEEREIIAFAEVIGYPLVIKPTFGGGGKGVVSNITDRQELMHALRYTRYELNYKDILVETYFEGKDYRIYVVGDKVIGAIRRIPANIIGDGKLSVNQLIKKKQKLRYKNPALNKQKFKYDQELHGMLKRQGYSLESIPENNKIIFLKSKNNISAGGDPIDATEELSDEMKEIAIKATKAIPGLVQAGVDMMVNKEQNNGVVIEMNSRPSIRTHLFPMIGRARDIPKAIIDYYFPETKANHTHPLFYFDFSVIWDSFKNGTVKECVIPDYPQGELISTRFIVSGEIQNVNYAVWVRKKARELNLNGYLKYLNNNDISIIVSGSVDSVNEFRNIINRRKSNYATVTKVVEKSRLTPVKIGFEIINNELTTKQNNRIGEGNSKRKNFDKGDYKMFVGYMRSPKKPGHMAKLLSITSQHMGINLIYVNPENVSIKTGKVRGKLLINNKWLDIETDLPKFIDINPNYFNKEKYQSLIKYLRENTLLSADKRMPLPKDELQFVFKDDREISKYLIPTKKVNSIDDITGFINKHQSVVLKPVRSNRGRNVYVIKKERSKYIVGISKKEKLLSNSEFKCFYKEQIKNESYIVQKYIKSRTKQGDPFDCRIHVEKNRKGEWANPKNFIRIGIGQKVVSNVSQGGGISDIKDFLRSNYNEDWKRIHTEIKRLARILPYKVEHILKQNYMTFGFDIGIDEVGNLYIFEVNDFPIVFPMKSEIAMLRAGYYKYVLESNKKEKDKKTSVKKERNKNKKLHEKNALLVKENNKIKSSISWKVTKPLRLIKKIIKS